MSQKYNDHLKSVLTADARLVDEQGDLMLNKVKDLVNNLDEKLLDVLLADDESRDKFFIKIKEVAVFKQREFIFYLEQNSLDNSFTSYANRIGLTVQGKFLKDVTDVVLDFPYKDCVLEGGQRNDEGMELSYSSDSYEEKVSKRKEVFFNNIIAKDEIDRLFEPKALVNVRRFTKDGEIVPDSFERDENGYIKDNLIIKGNNLLALHSLKKEFKGRVKLIYIDPPYNTSGAASTFAYNNSFNHSSWLCFMKNRLEIAKQLLADDGIIIVAIDHFELFYLGILLDEIFSRDNRMGVLAVVHNPGGRQDDKFFPTAHENMLVYAKNISSAEINTLGFSDEKVSQYKLKDKDGLYKLRGFRRSGSNSRKIDRPGLFYPIYYDTKTGKLDLVESANSIELLPVDEQGIDRCWRWGPKTFSEKMEKYIEVKKTKNGFELYTKERESDYKGEKAKTFWHKPYYTGQTGTNELKNIFNDKPFSYPKSPFLIRDVIQVATKENDLILDFFGGSGTTAAVAKEMNRQFITIEQMDYAEPVIKERLNKVIQGEKSGITDSVNWEGGGSFMYMELAKNNQKAIELLQSSESFEELENIFTELYGKYFLHYNVRIQEFKNKIVHEDNFLKLPLDKQKEMFIRMLDNNQLYVNVDDMEDTRYSLDPEDIRLTKDF